MEDIIIYGSGGMAKEVAALIEDINTVWPLWNIAGFVDDFRGDCGECVNGYRILGKGEILNNPKMPRNAVIAVGSPEAREAIYESIRDYGLYFPALIHPSARIARNAIIGDGSIIGIDCIVSVNVHVGNHVFLNMRTVVGHDAVLEDFASCLVNCIVAGDVRIGRGALLGSNSVIMEKVNIGGRARIGMGANVSFDVEEGHVVMNRPSKSMYFGVRDPG
jgi:sugar O-acyltransferase (sialic acid O-acetyltransferase NeuD family)